ncbi:MAG: cytochrome c3 family protein [Bacteroidota bacterium]
MSLLLTSNVIGQSVVGTLHDLSVAGPGTIKAQSESEVCIFCHTPHASRPASPLWNRNDPGSAYTLYSSSTLEATPGQPDGSAVLCLSCHDGTIALGEIVSRTTDITFSGGVTVMPPSNRGNLTTDLSDDHPVSFTYTPALATSDGQLKTPANIGVPVTLENGKVQCISCHDPHDNINTKFLVASKEYSALCFKCHDRDYWSSSTHSTSLSTWNGSGTDPWAHIENAFNNVSQNACANCHPSHTATGKSRLLKASTDEYNCLDCHNGNVATTDIETQSLKTYSHNVFGYNNLHDPTEGAMIATPHVECTDCHNPHATNNSTATAPLASGALAGVQGIDLSGNPVSPIVNEYELCFRCHSDNSVTSSYTARELGSNNLRLDFATTNVSHHAVVGPGNNPSPRGLINGYTASSQVYCTDCHASDGDLSVPAGPHGSIYPRILKANYNMDNNKYLSKAPTAAELATEFALCAQCHDMDVILNIHDMKQGHFLKYLSCNACHDPHGYPGGNTLNNSYLINLSTAVYSPGSYYELISPGTGTCNIECHNARDGIHHTIPNTRSY